MAPKLRSVEANSSDDASSEEGSDASSQDTTPPHSPTNPKPSSSADSDAETTTGAVAPPPVAKPAATTPVKSSNPKPQSSSADSTSQTKNRLAIAPPVVKSTDTPVKRPAEPQSDKEESKRAKKGNGASEKVKPRVWTDEDKIALVKGMINFEKNGVTVDASRNAFYNFIKGSLRTDVSKLQVTEKIRHLKINYLKHCETGRSVFKSHEKPLFNLCHKFWGQTNVILSEEPKLKKKVKKIKNDGSTTPHPHKPEQPENLPPSIDFVQLIGSGNHDSIIHDYVMKRGLSLIEASEREELDKNWARLQKKELEVYVERCGLVYKQAKMVLEAHK